MLEVLINDWPGFTGYAPMGLCLLQPLYQYTEKCGMHAHKICRSHETGREHKSFNEKKQFKKNLDRLSGELDLTKLLAGINVNIISRFASQLCGYRMRKMWLISVSYHH